jgi:hypothetical protein
MFKASMCGFCSRFSGDRTASWEQSEFPATVDNESATSIERQEQVLFFEAVDVRISSGRFGHKETGGNFNGENLEELKNMGSALQLLAEVSVDEFDTSKTSPTCRQFFFPVVCLLLLCCFGHK